MFGFSICNESYNITAVIRKKYRDIERTSRIIIPYIKKKGSRFSNLIPARSAT